MKRLLKTLVKIVEIQGFDPFFRIRGDWAAPYPGGILSRIWFRILFFSWGISVGVLSVLPGAVWPLEVAFGDSVQHLVAYAVLAGLAMLGFPAQRPWAVLALALALVAYGGILELVQMAVPGRFASVSDLFANTLGIFMGITAVRLASRFHLSGRRSSRSAKTVR